MKFFIPEFNSMIFHFYIVIDYFAYTRSAMWVIFVERT